MDINNVFSGKYSMDNFLNPLKNPAPLVELPPELNPFLKDKARIFFKAMYLTPLLNMKSYPAFYMLSKAKESGLLEGVHTLVEASSGNFALSLAILAPRFGIKEVIVIVPSDIATGKFELIRLSGAKVILHTESPQESGISKAREMGKRKGFLNLGQYENEWNPDAHEELTAGQVYSQTGGKISIFCAALGTTGTITGAREFFLKKKSGAKIIGVRVAPENAVPGVRTEERLRQVGFDYRTGIENVEIGTEESFETSLNLFRAGIVAGPSSGLALAGLFKFLKQQDGSGLERLRNEDGEIVAVVIFGDTVLPYTDKYTTHLPSHKI
jgi:cysteine synthase